MKLVFHNILTCPSRLLHCLYLLQYGTTSITLKGFFHFEVWFMVRVRLFHYLSSTVNVLRIFNVASSIEIIKTKYEVSARCTLHSGKFLQVTHLVLANIYNCTYKCFFMEDVCVKFWGWLIQWKRYILFNYQIPFSWTQNFELLWLHRLII